MGDPRQELALLWAKHGDFTFPWEWLEIVERFGHPSSRAALQSVAGAEGLLRSWGEPDLTLYDTYVAGHVSTILTGSRGGADVLEEHEADRRLYGYLELCLAEASDAEMQKKIETCRAYLEHLNRMLDVARLVPPR